MQVMTTLSGLLEQISLEWSSTSPARLRQMLKDAGGDVAGVSEKRIKKIKAWALASPVAVSVAPARWLCPIECHTAAPSVARRRASLLPARS
jgi:hypothetical protein